jgi:gliding motility-associated-like protein
LHAISFMALLFCFCAKVQAQGNQTVSNGSATAAASFPAGGCTYNWVNDTPGIGLPASGSGDIASFAAVNTGNSPVTATITATPVATSYAYIANQVSDNVTVINVVTNKVITTIPVGTTPQAVAVSPDGSRVYITNTNDNTISVINTATNTVISTFSVGANSSNMVVSPDGSRLYITNGNNTISVVSTATNSLINTILIGDDPTGIAISPNGTYLYVNEQGANSIRVINTQTYATIANITGFSTPLAIALSPDGSQLFVTNNNPTCVYVINTSTNTISSKIYTSGMTPAGIAVSPNGNVVYVANEYSKSVSVVNTIDGTLTATIAVGNYPVGVSVTPDGKSVYVTNSTANDVSVINTANNTVTTTVETGTNPISFGNFITPPSPCNNPPVTFTITVKPSIPQGTISPSAVTGTISTCAGDASASPDIAQFSVSGSNITTPITATAPTGFEVSLLVGSGYGSSVTITKNNEVVYVRSAAGDASGNISGNVVLSSTSAPSVNVAVTGIVNPLPTVNAIPTQIVANGAATAAINFTGTGNTFTWTNDTPGIGLPASGTGNIASFNAVNTGGTPITATITATPLSTGYAYIANGGSNTISVINTTTGSVVTNIIVGNHPHGIAISPDGSKVYVTNLLSSSVSVINTVNDMVIATIPVGVNPDGICISPDGNTLYVANDGSNTVSVIDLSTKQLVANIPVKGALGIAITPDGKRVYFATLAGVGVINTSTNTVVTTVPVTGVLQCIAITPDGSTVYAGNIGSNSVAVISTSTNTLVATIPAVGYPWGITISPDGSTVYVSDLTAGTVSILSTATNSLETTIPVGSGPTGISVNPDGSRVYVTSGMNSVSVIDTKANAVINTIGVGPSPDPFGNFVSSGASCTGPPITFNIIVKPSVQQPTITPTTPTGNISACFGNASASPDIERFFVSNINVTTPITATAPSGFEVSLLAGSGYGASVTFTQNNQAVYIRSAAGDAVGGISGNIILSSTSTPSLNIAVSGIINALPAINTIPSQTVTNGTATTAVNFTGTGDIFTWTNDTPGIGLPASGTGDITSFNAVNTGSTSVTATITATPASVTESFITNGTGVSVINAATNSVISTIHTGQSTGGVCASPDGGTIYVTNLGLNTVSVISTASNSVTATINVPSGPMGITVSPDGSKIYVANENAGSVSVINAATNTVIATIPVGSYPYGIAVSPGGSEVYVTNSNSQSVSVINTATNMVTATITVGKNPIGVTVSPDGSRVYIVNENSNSVTVINAANNAIITTISVGSFPECAAISPNGSRLYVTNSGDNSVTIINATSDAVIGTIAVGTLPFGICFNGDGSLLYVANLGTNNVSVINTTTNTVTATIAVGSVSQSIGNFVINGTGCAGQPATFTITVKPSIPQGTISPGAVTGTILACSGNASASPEIEQFSVSGTNITTPITATAPAGFEVSLSGASGYGGSVTITQNNEVVYVRSAAADVAGDISGNVVLSSTSAPSVNVAVTGIVNALPIVNSVSNQTIANGAATTAVNFTGTGDTFSWTNDTPDIGLPASGTGNIASFNAVNIGNTSVTATITVTPLPSGYAYVSNSGGSNYVSVINTVTQSVVTTIPVGIHPFGVVVSPDGTRVYITNGDAGTVSVINTITNQVVSTITVGESPRSIAISPDGESIYVVNYGSGTVSVISTATNTISAIISLTAYSLGGVSVSQDSKWIYVNVLNQNTIIVINAATNSTASEINTGEISETDYMATSPTGNRVYATSNGNSLLEINSITNTIIATIPLPGSANSIAVSPDGSRVYVTNPNNDQVFVINTITNAVVTTIAVASPGGISVTPDGTSVYVTNENNNTVSIISTATNTIVNTINVGQLPVAFGDFIGVGVTCPGVPTTFTITVKPSVLQGTISPGVVTGIISACAGGASASPDIEQFSVSGTNRTTPITVTAPAGFEVSLSSGSGYGGSVTINQNNQVVYVRSAAGDAAGNISGNVVLSSTTAPSVNVAVTGIVNALPTVNTISPQTVTNGAATAAVNFTGTGNTFTWTNDTPGIGLPASGTGNIASFNAVNTGSSPVTATVTVTPSSVGYAYIPYSRSNYLSVINTATQTVVGTITVGIDPFGIVVSPDGTRVYITNGEGTVSVIDPVTNQVINTINVGGTPTSIAISPDGKSIYVAYNGLNSISVISTATNAISATIDLTGYMIGEVSVSQDGKWIYATAPNQNTLLIINAATNAIASKIGINGVTYVAASPTGNRVYLTSSANTSLSVINSLTNALTASITLPGNATGMAVSPDGSRVYVTNLNTNQVFVVNTLTDAVVTTITVASPGGISVSPDGTSVYVTNENNNTVSIINAATNTIANTINVGPNPVAVGNFITPGTGCTGDPTTFTIKVNPTPQGTISPSAVTGSISACFGNASASPDIEQFSVSGTNVTTPIVATAPTGFEVSLSEGSGYGGSVTITQNNQVVYVRSAAADAAGDISGNVVLSSTGASSVNVAVTGVVNALPMVNQVSNQSVTNGSSTQPVNFTGTEGDSFSWTNDTPGIGLPASGTGNIASFNAVNTSNTPVTATVTVTPVPPEYAYIPNSEPNNVSVINTATKGMVTTIAVGKGPVGVVVSPDGTRVYITNSLAGTVSVINALTNQVISTITVGDFPAGIAISPDGSLVYVANQGSVNISVISTATNAVSATIDMTGNDPSDICVSQDGKWIYCAAQGENAIVIINAATNTIASKITIAGVNGVEYMTTSPTGNRVYVTGRNNNNLLAINSITNVLIATIPLGSYADEVAVSPDGSRAYVTSSNDVFVVNTTTDAIITTIPVVGGPSGVSVTPDGGSVYVTSQVSGNITVISTATNTITNTISAGQGPIAIGNFITTANGCLGVPINFTITVKPGVLKGTISASAVTGSISACVGNASASPDIEQFSVLGTNVTTSITATAPTGFEVSLSAGGGYGNSVTFTQNNQVVYVRSAAADAAGDISGNIVLSSTSAPGINVAVTGLVNALPTVNQVSSQSIANGAATQPVNFTGAGNTFTWTNDTPGIGLPASGTGNITSFNAVNTGNSPLTATVTVTPAGTAGSAYIPNSASNTVSVINTATQTVTATILVGTEPIDVAISPDGTRVYVTNYNNTSTGTVSVINAITNQVISTVAVGVKPDGIAISPDGSLVYVANPGSQTVSVISTATNTVSATINLSGYDDLDVSVSQDGKWIYVTVPDQNTIIIVNAATNSIASKMNVGSGGVLTVCTSPTGNRVYVTGGSNNDLLVINSTNNVLIANISLGGYAGDAAISPDGSRVYVASSNEIYVVNTITDAVVATIPVASSEGISVSPDGSSIYVIAGVNKVMVISTATNAIENTINVGQLPQSIGDFIAKVTSCPGLPITFTITVKPSIPQGTINASAVTGSISACFGNASASPDIEQFSVSGTNITTPITATAPTGFEVSLSAGTGYGGSITITQNNEVVYVRSAASDVAGSISGNIVLSSTSAASVNVAVTGIVNALPTVNTVSPQTVVNGAATAAINFTGAANTFTWTNNTPGIGLPASGAGNIPSFNGVNTGSSAVTATVTVTPSVAPCAYVPNSGSNDVSVINTVTQTLVADIPVGINPIGVAVSPDGTRAYIANYQAGTVSVINTITNQVINPITVGTGPITIASSPNGNYIYVVNAISETVSVISTPANSISATINLTGYTVAGISVSQDDKWIYVTAPNQNTILVINTADNSIASKIVVGGANGALEVATSPVGNRVYVTGGNNNNLLVINSITNLIIATIPLVSYAQCVAVSPDGGHVYVTSDNPGDVSVVNTVTDAVTTIQVPDPVGISVSPDGSSVYVTNQGNSNEVYVINTATNKIVNTIGVELTPLAYGNFITSGSVCTGTPITFTITVTPTAISPVIASTGTPSPLTTIYGTASASTSFNITGSGLTTGILVTAPAGFEVSTDNTTFTGTITVGSAGNVTSTTVYVRLAASTQVGTYSNNIVVLSSAGATSVNILINGTVTPAPLTITADNKTKFFDADNPLLTVTYNGFVNNDNALKLITVPTVITTAATTSPVGTYPITASGAASVNYTFTYIPGVLTIVEAAATIVIPNTFTPNGDGINDTWDIKNLQDYPNCIVRIYNRYGENLYSSIGYSIPWDGTYKGTNLPVGVYYYIINLKTGVDAIAGWVAIIR